MKKTNIFLFLLVVLTILGVGVFYLGYYGYEEKVTSSDIRDNINQSFPLSVKSTAGSFRLNKIEQIEIHKDKMTYFEISYTLNALNDFSYKGSFYFEAEILDSFEKGIISIRNVKLLRTSIDDSKKPLSEGIHKSIDYSIQKYIIDRRFQYLQIFNFHESWTRKLMFKLLREMSIEDNYIYLRFGLS